jgi:glycosyltransferase involved in cell wall biosynthesis
VNGFLFDANSDTELADAILKLAADDELRLRMGAKGRERALKDYDLARNVARWVEVLLPKLSP